MDIILIGGLCARVIVIFMGFVAMWSLWEAREARKNTWTTKMKDIWLCHILFVAASIEANVEYLYREVMPSASILVVGFIMLWTIKGVFGGEMYTKDQYECHRKHK